MAQVCINPEKDKTKIASYLDYAKTLIRVGLKYATTEEGQTSLLNNLIEFFDDVSGEHRETVYQTLRQQNNSNRTACVIIE